MAVTESRRHHLFELARSRLDDEAAETLFDMIGSFDSAEIATRSDVARVGAQVHVLEQDVTVLKQDVTVLKQDMREVKADLGGLRRDLHDQQGRYVSWLLASQAVIIASIGIATTVLIAVLY